MDLNAELAARHDARNGRGGLRAGRRMATIGHLTALAASILMWTAFALTDGSSGRADPAAGGPVAAAPIAVGGDDAITSPGPPR